MDVPIGPGVYFLEGAGLIKIGKASSLLSRTRGLAAQIPVPVELVGVIETPDPAVIEGFLHGRFDAQRQHGEWFTPSEELWQTARGGLPVLIDADQAAAVLGVPRSLVAVEVMQPLVLRMGPRGGPRYAADEINEVARRLRRGLIRRDARAVIQRALRLVDDDFTADTDTPERPTQ